MLKLKNLPIKYKFHIIIAGISCAIIVITGLIIGAYEYQNRKQAIVNDLITLAKLMANRSIVALTFNDPMVAQKNLESFSVKPSIVCAYILDPKDHLFANYQRDNFELQGFVPVSINRPVVFESGYIIVSQPILNSMQHLGKIIIRSDTKDLSSLITRVLITILIVTVFSFSLLFWITSKLHRLISIPILTLTRTIENITQKSDLSIKAHKFGNDELGTLVDSFNTMIEHFQNNNQSLTDSEKKYRDLFAFAPTPTLITNMKGRILDCNESLLKLLKINQASAVLDKNIKDFYVNSLDTQYYSDQHRKIGQSDYYEQALRDHHGQTFPASLTTRIIHFDGSPCLLTIVRNIEKEKELEDNLRNYAVKMEKGVDEKTKELQKANQELSLVIENLKDTQDQLTLSAHQAGMAEIAVSVLHNIGNVVNSINVRMNQHQSLFTEKETKSFEKLLELLQSEDFVSNNIGKDNDKYLKAIEYFELNVNALKKLNKTAKDDTSMMIKGLDHLIEIITLQQKYAGIKGFETHIDINQIIKDSLDMLMDSIQKRNINIQLDLQPASKVFLNKNKMMQIFINIVKNAYESIDVSNSQDKAIVISSQIETLNQKEYVHVTIKDTGAGIAEENISKLFQFGFSTKNRGTGFGLNDASTYIKAQRGKIEVESPGIGQGASVNVYIPIFKKDDTIQTFD